MEEKKSAALGIASLILGILSVILGCCMWKIGIPCAIMAIVLAAVSMNKNMGGKGLAIAGLVLGIVSLVLVGITVAFGVAFDAYVKKLIGMSFIHF